MMEKYILALIILIVRNQVGGAADYDVEQVKSPFVEKHDVGQLMPTQIQEDSPMSSGSDFPSQREVRRCMKCQFLPVGSSTSSFSSSNHHTSSSSSSGGSIPVYTQTLPVSSSSSRKEYTKKQKFVNGQQVYDLHHETEYKNGNLIKNEMHEKTPSDFGLENTLSINSNAGSVSSSSSHKHSQSSHQRIESESSFQSGGHSGVSNLDFTRTSSGSIAPREYEAEVERMKQELRRKTLGSQYQPSQSHGSSHKSEYETESKYINGQQVYHRKEEKKYRDGKLVHDVREEKGPEDFGVSNKIDYSIPSTSWGQTSVKNQHSSNVNRHIANRPTSVQSYTEQTRERQHSSHQTPNIYLPYNINKQDSKFSHVSSSQQYSEEGRITSNNNQRPLNREFNIPNSQSQWYYGNEHEFPREGEIIRESSKSSYYDSHPGVNRPSVHFTTMGNNHVNNQHRISSSIPTVHLSSYESQSMNRTNIKRPYSTNVNRVTNADYYQKRYPIISPSSTYKSQVHEKTEINHVSQQSGRYNINPAYDTNRRVNRHGSSHQINRQSYQERESQGNIRYRPNTSYTQTQQSHSSGNRVINTNLPLSWIETTTIWEYANGRFSGETVFNKFYENGILVHENQTQRNRDQMSVDGVNVRNLDLTDSELARYGVSRTSTKSFQRHEVHQVKRFKNGLQVYELNHERIFRDGNLIDEKREEKDEKDFQNQSISTFQHPNQLPNQSQNTLSGSTKHQTETGFRHHISLQPTQYTRKHEIEQQEKFVDGQKVYDLYHSREYKDGKLVNENRTELGPNQLGSHASGYRDYMKEVQSGKVYTPQQVFFDQESTANSVLKTSCLTCVQGQHNTHSTQSGRILNLDSYKRPQVQKQYSSTSYKHGTNIEGHYTGGNLVRGKDETTKWVDEAVVDSKFENYHQSSLRKSPQRIGSQSIHSSLISPDRVWTIKEAVTECAKKPCQNKGSCKARTTGPWCVCAFGFKGNNCQEAYCPERFCQNGGSCSIQNGRHVCGCPTGITGPRCGTQRAKIRIGVTG